MTQLSTNFSLEEATFSMVGTRAGIVNQPSDRVLANMQRTASHMEVVREIMDRLPVIIHSWYRCLTLNKLVGGSTYSDHMDGWAVDWVCPRFGTPKEIIGLLAEELSSFDQLIFEGSWIHSSFSPRLRKEILTAHFTPSGVTYIKGVVV